MSAHRLLTIAILAAGLLTPAVLAGEPPSLELVRSKGFEVTTLEGEAVPLASLLESGKPVLVEFWATWCVPCRKTLPHLAELHQRYRDRGLVIIALNVEDPKEDAEKVRRFAREQGMSFQVAFAPPELYRFLNSKTSISVPKVFVFDRNGRVAEHVTSYTPFTNRRVAAAVGRVVKGP